MPNVNQPPEVGSPPDLLLGHTAAGQLVKMPLATPAAVGLWGEYGNYLARLATRLVQLGWGVTYVGSPSRHPHVHAPRGRPLTSPHAWVSPAGVSHWLQAQTVNTFEFSGPTWLTRLVLNHQSATHKLLTMGKPICYALVLDGCQDAGADRLLYSLLQSTSLLTLVSLPPELPPYALLPDDCWRLVFSSRAGSQLAAMLSEAGKGTEVERLRAGWAYLHTPAAETEAIKAVGF